MGSEIEICIDELVLDGVPLTDRMALADALRSALAKALGQPANLAVPHSPCKRDRIDGGEIQLSRGDSASLGEALAATILSALRSSVSHPRGAKAP